MKSDLTLTELTLSERRKLLKIARARDLERKGSELPPIEPADRDGRVPLSFAQQRLWFLEQLGDLGSTYHISGGLRLRGEMDRGALGRALDGIVARHEVLRTTFAHVNGVPEQRIAPAEASGFALVEHDLGGRADGEAEIGRLMAEEAHEPFDLEHGPLIRGRLIRVAADDHVLLVTMHHLVGDGWSTGVFFAELTALYAAHREGREPELSALPVQYADFAVWQRRWVEGEVLREQADYWTKTLSGAPELLELPTDHPRPAEMAHAGARVELVLDEELTAGLKALSRRHGTTLFMTLLAGWAAVLGRLSGQESVVIGSPMAGRGRREIEGLIGFFVNTLALRVDFAGAPAVAELLERVKTRVLEAQHHQDIPFEQVVERVDPVRSMAHHPLFQVMFSWQSASGGGGLTLPGLDVGSVERPEQEIAKFDFALALGERDGRIAGGINYLTALFERETVERYAGYLRRALEEMVADEGQRVERLALIPADERSRVLDEWNRTEADYPTESSVHGLFERQAERTPEAPAVVFEGERIAYAELNARANRLAHHLRSLGVGPDVRVGVCVERSPEMVIALLAVLKAGGAYVPMDPSYPAERLAYMLADSASAAVLTQVRLRDRIESADVPVLELDAAAPAWADEPATNPVVEGLTPAHLAYVIYTSGSTGTPKGVTVEHRAVVNQLAWAQGAWALGAHEAVLQRISFSFDVSVRELFWPLAVGARLVLAGPEGHNDPDQLIETIAREGVGAVHMVPSLLQALVEHPELEACATLSRVMCGGEVLSPALARRLHERLPGATLYHMYGPTETTVAATGWPCRPEERDGRIPIGRPVANTRVYLLDAAGEPVPVGVAGELYIGGAQLARGYLGSPELTAERFVADAYGGEPGARLYRTGDLARWRPDGTLEFLGRTDHQVKVRGFRIELGEIEARLAEHASVREAVVLVREDAPGEKRLVAYVVGEESASADVLRSHLGETLPEYMVPAAYVRLETLPLTPNGKLDRAALPAPEGDAFAVRAYEPPAGDVEEILAGIWAEVLGAERVGRRDHFFELGGHSLLAVQVISRVRQVLEVEVALGELFTRPVLADFARGLETAARVELPAIEPAPREGRIPLSFAQQRLWFLEQLGGLGNAYHMGTLLRLRGELDRDALVRALDRIVARHEALRTTFAQEHGAPEQRIAPADAGFHLVEHDLDGRTDAEAELARLMGEEARALFDLERGPLIRGRLIRVAANDHVLMVTMHHIVSDGWSMGVLTREISALYGAFRRGEPDPLPELPVQYADYAVWQRRWVEGEVLREQADYWTRTLEGAPELLELPTDHPRPAHLDHAGARLGVELDEELTTELKALSRRRGTTLFMTLLAGWATVLGRLSGQEDVVVGTPSAGRGRREIEGLIGFFVNTLALRIDLADSPTVAELLARVKRRSLEAQQNQDIPFEQVVERVAPARSLSHTPLFQAMFAWQNAPRESLGLPGLAPGPVDALDERITAKQDLGLGLGETGGRIVGVVTYAASLFERDTVERWLGYFRRVLEEMAADEGRRVERLALMPESERSRVVEEWNRTEAHPAGSCIHELFQAQVERTPDAVAVVFGGEALSYAGLNARANRLAHHLRTLGVGPDAPVAICLERGPEMVVAVLAVLKAGGAYVPLDPAYPAERIAYMLADSAPAAVLTQAALRERIGSTGVPAVELDAGAPEWADRPATDPERGALTPGSLAYVIYTSGSTGRPKGVLVPHRNVARLFAATTRWFAFGETDVWTLFHSAAFDFSVWETWGALLHGGRLVVVPGEVARSPEALYELVCDEGVTVLSQTPSSFYPFMSAQARSGRGHRLRHVVFGGEALDVPRLREWFAANGDASPRLVNMYGITETTVHVTYRPLAWSDVDRAGASPIGERIPDLRAYLLDRAGEPVPVGVAGELYVGGAGVARGYLGRPELTAERFVADPFGGEPGARLYRTGDVARWRPGGTLEFVGRNDEQVKIRGFRIELGEIEARLREHPEVREAVVLAREDVPGERRLVAYLAGGAALDVESLRAHVGETLPEYMVPAAYVRLEAWPLTPNGKLDRGALPAPGGDAYASRAYEPPVGETEEALAEIWAEVLRVDRVGRWDHFFELGGHSLLAVQVISRVRQVLEVEVALGELFTRPVLRDFAREMETAARADLPPVEPAPREGRVPLSFAQQRLWFLEQMGNLGSAYHIPRRLRLRGELDRGALARALDRIVERHEALRTTFAEADGVPEQRIAPADAGFHLVEHDLGGRADAEAELHRLAAEEVRAPFDLARGPLVRGRLIRLADDDHALLTTMHHVVSDGWSAGVLTRELGALYGAFRRGDPDPLPALEIQYADYAVWQRRWVEGDVLREQADYWTRTLAGTPELLELPADHPRPAQADPAGARLRVELDEALTAALKALGRRRGTTLFMTLLAGWATLLARLSGQEDVVVGTPSAGRGRREIEGLIGFFVNTLALRIDLAGSPTVAELLGRVKRRALEAQQNQDIPFEQVVERVAPARSLSHTPLFQAMFAWQNAPRESPGLPGLAPGPVDGLDERVTAKHDLGLGLGEADGRIAGAITYATSLFEPETVERWLGYLRRVLEEMAADEGRPVDRLALMPESERSRVVEEWNRTGAAYPGESCVHELFEAQVERTPDAAAIVFDGEALSYARLNARANRLAHHLRSLGVVPGARVAICLERGPEMVIALLAVLKAGGAYVPLDPGYPAERIAYMLADSRPAVLLTQAPLAGLFSGVEVPRIRIDTDAADWAHERETDPERGALAPEHLAYVIYTSGSTGRPKGVMAEHRGACSLVAAQVAAFGVEPESRLFQFASFSFDASVSEVLTALCRGAALHLPPRGAVLAGETLVRALEGITHVTLPPSVLAALPGDVRLDSVRTLVTAGEALPEAVARRWAPGRRLINAYGPTEATVCAALHRCREGGEGSPPIGRPIANARVYLLDPRGEPVPVGVAGELYVGGAGVTRGYLGRPALTAERFVPDPFGGEAGARLYRTGDRGRWRPDGTIEFLGRVDFQVKVRGFRIEPGEVEARLMEHPAVREAVVIAREDVPGDARLVAYWVGEAVDADVLRAHLGRALPEHMVPAAYARLEGFPLTPNGKLDRGALPAPESAAHAAGEHDAPVGETEQALAEIWAEVLGVDRVGRGDHFFELGGHSLLAVQVASRVRQVLAVEMELEELFTRPVLRELAREVETKVRSELPPIEPAPRTGRLPLSFAQQRLWFLERLGNLGSAYHIRSHLRLRGEPDRAALARALDAIVARHEALRTTFVETDGIPEQRIAPADAGFPLREHDLAGRADAAAELRRVMAEEARAPFDLERGPLARGRLVRLAADDHVLLVTMHHIVSDGWSGEVFVRELSALYAAHREGREAHLPALPVQYADYALWQRRWVEGDLLREQADYWTRTLSGAPELLELPADRPRPARVDHAGERLGVRLDEELTAGLKALSWRHGTTLFMTLLAGWAVVLSRLSGQDDVVVGTPAAGRGRREIEELIGFFVQTLALRVDLSGAPTVAELLGRVKRRVLEAQRHQDIPFEQVVELAAPARSLSHHPLFQALLSWRSERRGEAIDLPGLAGGELDGDAHTTAKFDLSLTLSERNGRIVGGVAYATALFEHRTVERWAGHLRRVLEEMAADEGRPVDRLAMLPDVERRLVLEEWNATDAPYPRGSCVHELFRAQAARTPGAIAVSWRGERLAYAELEARANRISHALRRRGVGPEARVGICLPRTPELVAAMLGVLGAGGAYVPLDPAYPRERLGYMIEDAAVTLVITESSLADRLPSDAGALLLLDRERDAIAAESVDAPESGVLPENLSHVIFTSGSTGRPKGVMIRHSSGVVLLHWLRESVTDEERSSVLFATSINFDVSIAEVFGTLAWGGKLVLVENALELAAVGEEVVYASMVPSAAAELLRGGGIPPCVKTLNLGGEALPGELARGLYALGTVEKVGNLYGPTEDTTYSTYSLVPRGADPVRVGAPVANTRAYVLDRHLQPVPAGVAGELYLAGDGLSRGYANRPAMTAERFVPCPFGEPGGRMYRVMDRVRRRGDGEIEYLGRTDFQVKIRGHRVEPGEIEARLREHPAVREAVVAAREESAGDRRLVAYWVADGAVEVESLRAHLSERVPEYMVPAAYVRLDALPLTPNGKVDRQALPAPEGDAYARRGYEAPVGEAERALAEIWSELLGVERVGRWDHFFELGGHSLLIVKLIERMRRRGLHAEVGTLFTVAVLAELAEAVSAGTSEVAVPANAIPPGCGAITPEMLPLATLSQAEIDRVVAGVEGGTGNVQDIYGLAPLQHGILFHHLLNRDADPYVLASLYGFERREELEAYVGALRAVIDRHDILRTAIAWEGLAEPVQVVWRRARLEVEEVELDPAEGDARQALWARSGPRRARLDVGRAPLMRACAARDAERGRWLLLLQQHHLITDHGSMEVLREEIRAHLEGREAELPAPLPFRAYVAQARLGVSEDEHRAFFTGLLGDVDEPTAPFGVLDARGDGSGMREARLGVDGRLAARLRERARALGVSAASLVHVAWAQVLARASGRDDVVFGTLLFGRMHGGEGSDRVMGPFINTLPIRIRLGRAEAAATVRETHALLAKLLHHEHASLALAQRCGGVEAPAPLFTALLNYRHSGGGPRPGAAAAPADGARTLFGEARTNYPLTLSVDDLGEGFRLQGQVAHASLDPVRVCGLVHRALEGLVEALETAPHRSVGSIDVLPAEERSRVLEEWNRTEAAYPAESCAHELFEAQVERTPGAAAVVFEGGQLTYAELNARANRLAHHLVRRGVGPDILVGLCLERGSEMVVAVLAVLKAGGAYVPLDPEYPADRLEYMLADSAPAVLLTQASLSQLFAGVEIRRIRIDADAEDWAGEPEMNPARGALTPEHLAYVIYTSGSTGRPKGVMNQHRTLVNRLAWGQRTWGIDADEAVLLKTSLSFDGSVREIFLPLMAGARVVIARPGGHRDPSYLLEVIGREGISTVNLVPSLLQVLLEAPEVENLRGLKRILCGGEALPGALLERFRAALPAVELHNLYGPSEAATAVTSPRCEAEPGRAGVPIGGPIANTRVYVLDGAGEPVPIGVAGELYIGGAGVARGYLRRAAMTAERFVPDPFGGEAGARLYRTGDVARWLADGRLDFVGRNDAQVKVRGFRVEPDEIAARLREHAGVREAVVIAREDAPGDRRLVAYVVGDANAEALRAHLIERLPEYMVPAAYVRLETLPLTPSEKVDRRALPAPEGGAYAAREYEPPVGETEAVVAELWADVLRVDRVGRRDHFFELGGHSLLAVQVISRVRQVLEVEVPLGELFTLPVLEDFARAVGAAARAELPPIEPASREGRVPLSFAQQRLWFLEQLGNLGSTYHISRRLRLRGALDRAALARALDRIMARHEALRTTFAEADGVPEQRVAPADVGFHLVEHDLTGQADAAAELHRLAAGEARAPFDLERGPLIRGRLVRLAADDHVLLTTMHHIVGDGWSTGVLTREISTLYGAFRRGEPDPLPALPVQYADYAVWQRRWVEGDVLREQADYWTRTLAGAPELLALPTDRARPPAQDFAGGRVLLALDAEPAAALKALSRRHGTTLFMTLLAGWAALLGRLSGQDDVVVGTPTANRGRREIEGLIGFFLNTLALRVDLSGAPAVAALLGRVRTRALEAQAHQDIPFEQVVERLDPARSLAYTPLFQAMFTWQNAPRERLQLPGLEPGGVDTGASEERAKLDLSLSLREAGDRIVGEVTYATALFDRATVERYAGYLRRVLEEMAADESRPVERLALMPEGERARVVEEWNRTEAAYPDESCVHELFERQVERRPDAAAVVFGVEHLTYAELDRRANRLAHRLRSLGVGPDARVAICLERGAGMIVALLGVMKAGGAYVPLDPGHPEKRLRWMVEDSGAAVVLTRAPLRERFAGAAAAVLEMDALDGIDAEMPETNPWRAGLTPGHLAYAIYTSGSTGLPKGVMVPHRGVVNSVEAFRREYRIVPGARVLLFAPLHFDASVLDVFTALASGAALVVGSYEELVPGDALIALLRRHQVTHAKFTPSALAALPDAHLPELGAIMSGGEACPAEVVERWAPGRRFYNGYGPTETSVRVTVIETADATRPPPIGRAVANVRLYVVDPLLQPVPVGVAGELCVGGIQVARGYAGQPRLTAERFVADPFGEPGARLYRTGDRARWLADGTLEFLGRTDHQVKVRGFRIEPGEIEARLSEHPEVRAAVVLAREDAPGDARLAAYWVGEGVEAEALRAHVGETLPEYMVPAAWVRLEQLPLTPAGKLDRGALPAPEGGAYLSRAYEPPADETEEALAEIWAEVLRVPRVGRRDSFFELGGHSLLAVRVVARVREVLEVKIPLRELFTRPVLEDFARQVLDAQLAQVDPEAMAQLLALLREPTAG